ncbi:MAG: sulfatase-like hydrolase/transferase [Cyclobacteriaceae bacterium]|nr:sulfatase-like hydrolase/transferase [Cyclobacteriaceae bacterium]
MKSIFFLVVAVFSIPSQAKDKPNILWITHEDLSPIYGCYGDEYAHTPNIDKLAESSIRFLNAYSNAPICAPARSTLITGMYATSLGTQHLRSEIPVPENMKILPEVLREAGYYTSNNVKTDYNFSHEGRWDESSNKAHWRNRPEGKPFFSVFNFMITHESRINRFNPEDTKSLNLHHNPDNAQLPPFLPDSPRMKEIWAHSYDLLSVFDLEVKNLLEQLKEDGLYENTIIFIFSDHGTGLPGYKRWLNNAGLQVPFILHVPDKFKKWAQNLSAPVTDRKVGFVDFAPTVISLAGAKVPDMMEGRNFLGRESKPKKYIFGYRDRADDCYEMSRSVTDGRYLYVRHFMPQLPYFQEALIFSAQMRGSYEEIQRLKWLGQLSEPTQALFRAKPVEALFDLQTDPFEQNNLIANPEYTSKIDELKNQLFTWMLDYHDTGLLNEGEYMLQAKNSSKSVYETIRQYSKPEFRKILESAHLTGKINKSEELVPYLQDKENAVRYWALVAADAFDGDLEPILPLLKNLLEDDSYSVAIMAAEILVKRYSDPVALQKFEQFLKIDNEPVVLQAAISLRRTGNKAAALIPLIENEIMPKFRGDVWGRYKNWSYPMFIGMALDQTMINCGKFVQVR